MNNKLNEKKIDVNKNGKRAFVGALIRTMKVASIVEKMYADYYIFSAIIATFVPAKSIKESSNYCLDKPKIL